MPPITLEQLFQNPQTFTYNKGQIILYAGDELTNVIYLKHGYVKMYLISDEGEEKILMIFPPSSAFPIFANMKERLDYRLKYFYGALTRVELDQMPRLQFAETVEKSEESTRLILSYITDLAGDLVERLQMIENKNALKKIANLLKYLIKVGCQEIERGVYQVNFKITHQDIAAMSGLTRETASVQLKHLEKDGVISQPSNGHLIIYSANIPT